MKHCIFGDTQLDAHPGYDKLDSSGVSIRAGENFERILAMLKEAKDKHGCSSGIHLGDITEEKNPDSKTGEYAANMFRTMLDWGWVIDAILGNHDASHFSISSSSITPLAIMAGRQFRVHHDFNDQGWATFLPYLHKKTPAEIGKLLESVKASPRRPLFAHYAYQNSVIGPRNLILPGDKLSADQIFPEKFNVMFFGHVHGHQTHDVRGTTLIHVGSPVFCDMGERKDKKGYAVYDDKTGEWAWHEIKQTRNWVMLDFQKTLAREEEYAINGEGPLESFPRVLYSPDDIVCIKGEYDVASDYNEIIKRWTSFSNPFVLKVELSPMKTKRELRGEEIANAAGFKEAAAELIKIKYADDSVLAESVLRVVTEKLDESRRSRFGSPVTLGSVRFKGFTSYQDFYYEFPQQTPLIICGKNSIGKTNLPAGVLFAIGGDTPKGMSLSGMVRQGSEKASVEVTLKAGIDLYRITRVVTLGKKSATQKIWLESFQGNEWKDISDGGVDDIEAIIANLVGGKFLALKSTSFSFQKDPLPLITATPGNRKKVFGEIIGFEPISRAFKLLNEARLKDETLVSSKKSEFQGMEQVVGEDPEKRLEELTKEIQELLVASQEAQQQVLEKKSVVDRLRVESDVKNKAFEAVQGELNCLPNTLSKLTAAEASLNGHEQSTKTSLEVKRVLRRTKVARLEALKAVSLEAPNLLALQTSLAEIETNLKMFREDSLKQTQEEARLREVVAASEKDLEQTRLEKRGFEKNDIGTCGRCGQIIDSSHIELEIQTLTSKIALFESVLKLNQGLKDARTVNRVSADRLIVEAEQQKRVFQGGITKVTSELQEINLLSKEIEEITAAGKKEVADAETTRLRLRVAVESVALAHTLAEKKRLEVQKSVDAAREAMLQGQKIVVSAFESYQEADQVLAKLDYRHQSRQISADNIAATLKKMKAVTEAVAVLEASLKVQVAACSVLDPRGGLPVYLIDVKLPFLEERVNYYMRRFGKKLAIRMSTLDGDKESLEILVDNGKKPDKDVANYSGSDLDIIEISLKFALTELLRKSTGVEFGFLCLDEPGCFFDDETMENFVQLLYEKCQTDFPTIVLISHDKRLLQSFDHKLMLGQGVDEETIIL